MSDVVMVSLALAIVAAGMPFLAWWWQMRHWGLPVRVTVDPYDPQPADVARYLTEIARRLDARPERMRVVFNGENEAKRLIVLDLDADGALRISVDGQQSKRANLRGRWIADHPVPFDLHRAVLYIDPVDANRFRVQDHVPFRIPALVFGACSLLACAAVAMAQPFLLAVAVGGACGSCLVAKLAQ